MYTALWSTLQACSPNYVHLHCCSAGCPHGLQSFWLNGNPGYSLCLKCLLKLTCPAGRIKYLSVSPVLGIDMTDNTETAGIVQMKHFESRCPAAEFSYMFFFFSSFIRIFAQMGEIFTIQSEECKYAQGKHKPVETYKGKSLHSQPPFYSCFVYYTNMERQRWWGICSGIIQHHLASWGN